MAPPGSESYTDWVWCRGSNVHIANHRKGFTTLTKIESRIDNTGYLCSGDKPFTYEVRGVGDVELDVVVQENRMGPEAQKKVILRNVLYIPNTIYNVLGEPISKSQNREKGTSKQENLGFAIRELALRL
ncbi:hypothetical protein CKM354_000613600 [Cercospora kikuchii]|uniref:Uncharacterized protein n=1 Tax=Cercospora kikuchii TaxID=84275 RepID=A0A9P3FD41_9PEZI|nr:uncharacterized protein CKM354_000613600 [Cercospora kikuchii]GIZ42888.1 hypothetical protein CKM354_000613600 [Cercospora kikuchii]